MGGRRLSEVEERLFSELKWQSVRKTMLSYAMIHSAGFSNHGGAFVQWFEVVNSAKDDVELCNDPLCWLF